MTNKDIKTLEEIQQENRKMILEAIHGCSYEEALEREEENIIENSFFLHGNIIKEYVRPENFYKGLGKPLTLDRVLLVLQNVQIDGEYAKFDIRREEIIFENYIYDGLRESRITSIGIAWELTKLTLEQQSEKTQRAINQLLNNQNNDK